MKTNLAAGTVLSLLFWSLLSVSLFAAPLILSTRDSSPTAEVEDLIRQHQEATSPLLSLPGHSSAAEACELPGQAAVGRDAETMVKDAGEGAPDAPMIRPVGKRATRIQV